MHVRGSQLCHLPRSAPCSPFKQRSREGEGRESALGTGRSAGRSKQTRRVLHRFVTLLYLQILYITLGYSFKGIIRLVLSHSKHHFSNINNSPSHTGYLFILEWRVVMKSILSALKDKINFCFSSSRPIAWSISRIK